eukprot:scaffold1741_cov262-Pinguiococcus_pyrenoidosus.AAC.41
MLPTIIYIQAFPPDSTEEPAPGSDMNRSPTTTGEARQHTKRRQREAGPGCASMRPNVHPDQN